MIFFSGGKKRDVCRTISRLSFYVRNELSIFECLYASGNKHCKMCSIHRENMRFITVSLQMPFGIQIVRCPKCNQPVYHAEEIPAAGKKWHKLCFKCGKISIEFSFGNWYIFFLIGLCKKMLESTTVAEHEGNLFCKQCYARKFVSIYRVNSIFNQGIFTGSERCWIRRRCRYTWHGYRWTSWQ